MQEDFEKNISIRSIDDYDEVFYDNGTKNYDNDIENQLLPILPILPKEKILKLENQEMKLKYNKPNSLKQNKINSKNLFYYRKLNEVQNSKNVYYTTHNNQSSQTNMESDYYTRLVKNCCPYVTTYISNTYTQNIKPYIERLY